MGIILFFWIIFQSIVLMVIHLLSAIIPFNIYYSLTIIVFSPLALLISLIVYKCTHGKKDVFTQTLFGSTTIFHIILMLYLPNAVMNFPKVIETRTETLIENSVKPEKKRLFLKKLNTITEYTTNLMFVNVEVVGMDKWQELTELWQEYIKDISDNILSEKEISELSIKIDSVLKELNDEDKKN